MTTIETTTTIETILSTLASNANNVRGVGQTTVLFFPLRRRGISIAERRALLMQLAALGCEARVWKHGDCWTVAQDGSWTRTDSKKNRDYVAIDIKLPVAA